MMRNGSPADPPKTAARVSDTRAQNPDGRQAVVTVFSAMWVSLASTAAVVATKSTPSCVCKEWCGMILGAGLAFMASLATMSFLPRRRLSWAITLVSRLLSPLPLSLHIHCRNFGRHKAISVPTFAHAPVCMAHGHKTSQDPAPNWRWTRRLWVGGLRGAVHPLIKHLDIANPTVRWGASRPTHGAPAIMQNNRSGLRGAPWGGRGGRRRSKRPDGALGSSAFRVRMSGLQRFKPALYNTNSVCLGASFGPFPRLVAAHSETKIFRRHKKASHKHSRECRSQSPWLGVKGGPGVAPSTHSASNLVFESPGTPRSHPGRRCFWPRDDGKTNRPITRAS